MSKGIFINTLNTYIGTALYEEFLGPTPEESEWELYSTYFEKEDSSKPAFVKKMMKQKSKPGLFRKYMLEKFDYFIYDMHSGRLEDLKFCIKALTKTPLNQKKTVIMLSSVLSWANTEHKMVEDKPEAEENEDEKNEDNNEENMEMEKSKKEEELTEEEKAKLEEYLDNGEAIDEDGNPIEVKDEEGNPMDPESEDYPLKLKQNKILLREEKRKAKEPVKEIKVNI